MRITNSNKFIERLAKLDRKIQELEKTLKDVREEAHNIFYDIINSKKDKKS